MKNKLKKLHLKLNICYSCSCDFSGYFIYLNENQHIFELFSLSTTPGVSKYRDQISQENIEEIIRTDRRAGNLVNKLRNVTGGGREVECVPPLDAEIFR